MATVQLIDNRVIANVELTNIEHVGDEGARRAIAHIEGKQYPVYNSIIDGFDPVWYEQITLEMYRTLGKTGFVEGSLTIAKEDQDGTTD